jgi:hypothetical protein
MDCNLCKTTIHKWDESQRGSNFVVLAEVRPRQLRIIRPLISTKIVPEYSAMSFNWPRLDRPIVARDVIWFLLKCRSIAIVRRIFRTLNL